MSVKSTEVVSVNLEGCSITVESQRRRLPVSGSLRLRWALNCATTLVSPLPNSCQSSPETAASPGGKLPLTLRAIALVKNLSGIRQGSVKGWLETRVSRQHKCLRLIMPPFPGMDPTLKDICGSMFIMRWQEFDSSLFLNCALVTRRGWNLFVEDTPEGEIGILYPDVEVLRMMQSTGSGSAAVEAPLATGSVLMTPAPLTLPMLCRLKFGLRAWKLRHRQYTWLPALRFFRLWISGSQD